MITYYETHKFAVPKSDIDIGRSTDPSDSIGLTFMRSRWQAGVTRPPSFDGTLGFNLIGWEFFDVTFYGDSKGGLGDVRLQAAEFAKQFGYHKITR